MLPATNGEDLAFERGPAILVFFRGHWCPICRRQLRSFEDEVDGLRAAGIELLAISNESVEEERALAQRLELSFPLLSDPDRRVIQSYRAEDVENHIAAPATFVIDAEGIVRWSHVGDSAMDRPRMRKVIEAARAVQAPAASTAKSP